MEILTANFGAAGGSVDAGRRDVDGVPVTYLRRIVSRGFLSVAPGAGRVVRAGFDVVHAFGLRDGVTTAAMLAARRAGVPLVLEPMGMAVPRIRSTRMKSAFDRVFQRLHHHAAATIATSAMEADELRPLGYANVVVRANPIAASSYDAPRSWPIYDLCYVGRLHEKKRLGDIVAALAAHQEWTAVVAGPDEDGSRGRLLLAAQRAGVGPRLTIKDWVADVEKSALIRSSKVFVLPSLAENFGNAAAEAIALGTPVVVTDTCGVAEIVAATGTGAVAAVDTSSVIRAIERVVGPQWRPVAPDALRA